MTELEMLRERVAQLEAEVASRKLLNEVQVEYRKGCLQSQLDEIGRAVSVEYGDFLVTKDVPMTEMLGEIYREKVANIFKILERKGIPIK